MTVEWNGDEIMRRVREGAFRGTVRGAYMVQETATNHIVSGPKTGRVYRRRGVSHQASAPGEPPASDTGRLAASEVRTDKPNLTATVNWTTAYALGLEIGTERAEPRPYARRSLVERTEDIGHAVAEEVEKALR